MIIHSPFGTELINFIVSCLRDVYKSYEYIVFEENEIRNYEQFMNKMGLRIM